MTISKNDALAHANQTERGNLTALGTLLRGFINNTVVKGNDKLAVEGGSGIVGIAESYATSVKRDGGLIKTEIVIDLTGLRSTGANDIIGDDGTPNPCHIGQITAARNGTIIGGLVTCLELPAGGDPDIDLYSAVEGTGVEDGAIGDLDETQLTNGGDHVAGTSDAMTALPAADEYLYLVAGDATDADYTAGKLLIELWGTPVG